MKQAKKIFRLLLIITSTIIVTTVTVIKPECTVYEKVIDFWYLYFVSFMMLVMYSLTDD